jgi:hypothetical protein
MTAGVTERTSKNGTAGAEIPKVEAEPVSTGGRLLSIAGVVRGDEISVRNGIVGGITGERITIDRGFARAAIAGDELRLERAGAGMVLSAGSAELHQAGAQAVVAGGSIHMKQAGSAFALARQIDVGEHGTVVFGITPNLQVNEGGRLVFGPRVALPILGTLFALLTTGLVFVIRRVRSRARIATSA